MSEHATDSPPSTPPQEMENPSLWARLFAKRWRLAMILCVTGFFLQMASLRSPTTGYSSFIMIGDQGKVLTSLREAAPYVYHRSPGYDGQAYVQLALDPLLRSPELESSVDNLPYRARRILMPWVAWVTGLGQPAWIVQSYALINVFSWFILAILLLRWLPPTDAENFLRWAAVMFSYGLMQSLRGALTDGPAVLLLLAGVALLERRKTCGAIGFLAASILCRETLVLGAAASLAQPAERRGKGLFKLGLKLCVVVLPFLLWLAYLRWATTEVGDAGARNFEPPLVAFFKKCVVLAGDANASSFHSWPYLAGVLAVVAVFVQFAFFLLRWRPAEIWWRVGASFAVLMAVLGTAVWEGIPGAFTRVLLPMTVAFNLALPRGRRWLPLLILGNLGLFGGLQELAKPTTEFARWEGSSAVVSTVNLNLGEGWYEPEAAGGHRWAWCVQTGDLTIENHGKAPLQVQVSAVVAVNSPCLVTLRGPGGVLWTSELITKNEPGSTKTFLLPPGTTSLRFESDRPSKPGPGSDTRLMAFAVKDLVLKIESAKP